jgi:hypothetical protein
MATKLAKISDAVQSFTKLDFVYRITAQKRAPELTGALKVFKIIP